MDDTTDLAGGETERVRSWDSWRGDDGAGIEVALRVGGVAFEGDGTGLVDAWAGADDVVVVDAAAPAPAAS